MKDRLEPKAVAGKDSEDVVTTSSKSPAAKSANPASKQDSSEESSDAELRTGDSKQSPTAGRKSAATNITASAAASPGMSAKASPVAESSSSLGNIGSSNRGRSQSSTKSTADSIQPEEPAGETAKAVAATSHAAKKRPRSVDEEDGKGDNRKARSTIADDMDASKTGDEKEKDATEKAPALKHGRLSFTLNKALQPELVCELCMGYFRDPTRITSCLHVFCKSCLLLALERAGHQCPTCQLYLGRLVDTNEAPFKPDRLLQHVMDKILFPEIAIADEKAEADFYAGLDIQLKKEFRGKRGSDQPAGAPKTQDRSVSFHLAPGPGRTALQRPFLETTPLITVSHLKKHLQQQEDQQNVNELSCAGTNLGNEWSVDFIRRTIWNRKSAGEGNLLTIEYR
jgi:hypothetical protein